jgi:hypothetical protein
MNRNQNLQQALENWLKFPEIQEIIIVDWSSDSPVSRTLQHCRDSRVKIVRVEKEDYWILSYAFNLAASLTSREKLLKLDADVLLEPNFFTTHPLGTQCYWAGDWRNPKSASLSGLLYITRHDFFTVNGYNEFIRTYGWDDIDLYDRLDQLPHLTRCDLNVETVSPIPHPLQVSFAKQVQALTHPALNQHLTRPLLLKEREFQNRKNKYISQAFPWSPHYQRATYQQNGDHLIRVKTQEHPIRPDILIQAEAQALIDCLRFTYHCPQPLSQDPIETPLTVYLQYIFQALQSDNKLPEHLHLNPPDLKQFYQQAIQQYPYHDYLYAALARLLQEQSDVSAALRANAYALQFNPKDERHYQTHLPLIHQTDSSILS